MRAFLVAVFASLSLSAASAQTVYKCESKGSVVYSHEPCVGAKTVDTTATQGLDKSSGTSRKGADVRQIEQNRALTKALRPLLNETEAQRDTRHRRFKLPPGDKLECAKLDARLPVQETALHKAAKADAPSAELALFESRKRYRELRC